MCDDGGFGLVVVLFFLVNSEHYAACHHHFEHTSMDFTQGIPVIPVQPIVFVPVNDVVMGGMSSSSFAWDESEA